ncbi:MAG: MoaD/ThiS family protein [Planctomycetales bacterium]|nr:MoaD/ThiS family protein [Planctomycetales bacterium]
MNITVHYTTQLRAALGTSEQSLELDAGTTVRQLIQTLAQLHPDAFNRLVLGANGAVLPNLIVCVDDRQIQELDVPLESGQSVTLLSAISGG